MNFIDPALEQYCEQHSDNEPELLKRLVRDTHLKTMYPRMLSGHLQGRFLRMLSKLIQAERVLEIGTFTGYSAICLAESLSDTGKLYTIDINDETSVLARQYFEESGLAAKIDFRIGDALQIVPTIEETFDLVFIDADKNNYVNYFELILPKVRTGGLIIADNVLWSGRVLTDETKMDPDTRTLLELARKVKADERVERVMIPLRDGLLVMRKK